MGKIKKINQKIVQLGELNSFSLIGDPGCEGLGTSMMKVYVNALEVASRDDMILIAGDLVPSGTGRYYKKACSLTDAIARKDIYILRGNHDTGEYGEYFGLSNYALISDHFTIVVMDNADRTFAREGLDLLAEILAMETVKNVVIAFHIPIPNHIAGNTVSEEEYGKLRDVYLPYREKIKYIVCGHVHSCFTDQVDGIPLVCTGGGGAVIEDVSEHIKASDVDHHIVRFAYRDGRLTYQFVDLNSVSYLREVEDSILTEKLDEAVKGELYAHLRYLMFAERARKRGYDRIANLFDALAESEYRHARNFFAILDQPGPFTGAIQDFIPCEKFEYEKLYKMMGEYAREKGLPLSDQAFRDASAAERVHAKWLEEARDIDGFSKTQIYVCPVCGYVIDELESQERCLRCGAPVQQFLPFIAE